MSRTSELTSLAKKLGTAAERNRKAHLDATAEHGAVVRICGEIVAELAELERIEREEQTQPSTPTSKSQELRAARVRMTGATEELRRRDR